MSDRKPPQKIRRKSWFAEVNGIKKFCLDNPRSIRGAIRRASRSIPGRQKTLYSDGVDAAYAMGIEILTRLDKSSGYVFSSATTLTVGAGLAYRNKNDEWDISRGRRALRFLRQVGAVSFDDGMFNPVAGCCDSLRITITPFFADLFGDSAGRLFKSIRANLTRHIQSMTGASHVDITATFEDERQRVAEEHHQKRINHLTSEKERRAGGALDLKKLWQLARMKAERIRRATRPMLNNGWHITAQIVTDMMKLPVSVPQLLHQLSTELAEPS